MPSHKNIHGNPREKRQITQAQLSKVKENHRLWLAYNGRKGKKANFSNTDLSGMDLSYCDFSHVSFYNADLSGTSLRCANLYKADLTNAVKSTTDLRGANTIEAIIQNNAYSRIADLIKTFPFIDSLQGLDSWNTKNLIKILVGMEKFLNRELDESTVLQFLYLQWLISPGHEEDTGIDIYKNPLLALSGSYFSFEDLENIEYPESHLEDEQAARSSKFAAEAFLRGINIPLEWRKDISQVGLGIRYCKEEIDDNNTCAVYSLSEYNYPGLLEVYCTDRYLEHSNTIAEMLIALKERSEEDDYYDE